MRSMRLYVCVSFFIFHCKIMSLSQIILPPIQHSHVEQFLDRAHQQMDQVYLEFNKNIYNKGLL